MTTPNVKRMADQLVTLGTFERVPRDPATVAKWVNEAERDLATATRLAQNDHGQTYATCQDAIRKALIGLLADRGLRPLSSEGGHLQVPEWYVALDGIVDAQIQGVLDRIRRPRRQAELASQVTGPPEVMEVLRGAMTVVEGVQQHLSRPSKQRLSRMPPLAISRGSLPTLARASLLSPFTAFPALWLLGMGLSQIHLVAIQQPWPTLVWLVMTAVPLAFILGGLLSTQAVRRRTAVASHAPRPVVGRRLRIVMTVSVGLGFLELAHQFVAAHTIPLFASNIDSARLALPNGPTILLTDLLTVAAIIALTIHEHPLAHEARFDMVLGLLAVGGLALEGGRQPLLLPIVTVVIARTLFWGPPRPRVVVASALSAVIVITGLFYVRTLQHRNQPFEHELYSQVLPSTPALAYPLLPADLSLSLNFEALSRVIQYFPAEHGFGHGAYDAQGLHLFVPGTKSIGQVSAQISPPWITSTIAGTFWADGGFPLVIVGVGLIGLIVCAAFAFARRVRAIAPCMVAAYLLYQALFGVYTNFFTTELDWLLVTPLLGLSGCLLAGDAVALRPALRELPDRLRVWWQTRLPDAPSTAARKTARRLDWLGPGNVALRRIPVAVALIVLAILAAQVPVITRDQGNPILAIAAGIKLPRSALPTPAAQVTADSDLPGTDNSLWTVQPHGLDVVLSSIRVSSEGGVNIQRFTVPSGPVTPATRYAITNWSGSGLPALAIMRPSKSDLEVSVVGITGAENLITTRITLGPTRSPGRRDLFLGHFAGTRPDLYVLDRGIGRQRIRLRVFSGDSGFRLAVVDRHLPVIGTGTSDWLVLLTKIDGGAPDLVILELAQPMHALIVHKFSSALDFLRDHQFSAPLPFALGTQERFAVAGFRNRPALFVFPMSVARGASRGVVLPLR
jgi:oligosaccharide repeat unit polymerase